MLLEEFLQQPGFIYEINGKMCRNQQEEKETNMYFQKIRAYSDFALEVPYNPEKIKSDMQAILETLSDENTAALSEQLAGFKKDLAKYCE